VTVTFRGTVLTCRRPSGTRDHATGGFGAAPESAARRLGAVDRRLGCIRGYDGWAKFLAQRSAGNRQDGDEEPDRQRVYAPERARRVRGRLQASDSLCDRGS
jgi:hypothetical protein